MRVWKSLHMPPRKLFLRSTYIYTSGEINTIYKYIHIYIYIYIYTFYRDITNPSTMTSPPLYNNVTTPLLQRH